MARVGEAIATLAAGKDGLFADRLCRMRCQRPVCPGRTRKHFRYDTCCRSCTKNLGHDPECEARWCQYVKDQQKPGSPAHGGYKTTEPQWVDIKRGERLPRNAIHAGRTVADGELYVARYNGEAGKLNVDDSGMMWNIWCHSFRWKPAQSGDILVYAGKHTWMKIKRGDVIPSTAVRAGETRKDGSTYVGRLNGEAGKINTDEGTFWSFWCRQDGEHEAAEILIVEGDKTVLELLGDPPPGLSYVGTCAWRALKVEHPDREENSWNISSGKVIGEILQTPPKQCYTSQKISDDIQGCHSDFFPEKFYSTVIKAKRWVDITSLAPPDGKFEIQLAKAIEHLAEHAQETVTIRLLFGNIIGMHINCDTVLRGLVKGVKDARKIKVWVGAWRKGVSWNHAKIVAVDGRHLLVGGHNMWDAHYLQYNPVRDLSTELEGSVTHDGHLFANEMWRYIIRKHRESKSFFKLPDFASLVKGYRVCLTANVKETYPPMYSPHATFPIHMIPDDAKKHGECPIISCGRHGALNVEGTMDLTMNPSDGAITAMIASAKKIIRMSLQDLGPLALPGPRAIPGGVWPKDYLRELGKAICQRGVDVEIVVSGPNLVPGPCSMFEANYGNGWTCADVASEIIKEVINSPMLCEVRWAEATWRKDAQDEITQYRASSEDATNTLLAVRDVNGKVVDILDGDGNICEKKCDKVGFSMFPLKVCVFLGEATLRKLILENLRVTYMRSTLGHKDWEAKKVVPNHAKFFIVDDLAYYIGSQNLYVCNLAEWGIIIDDEAQTKKVLEEYWNPMWQCSYKQDPPDCDVEDVMKGLETDRNGQDTLHFRPDELEQAEQLRHANDGGGTAKGMSLAVLVKSAEHLKNADFIGKSDPYVDLSITDEHGNDVQGHLKTSTINNDLNPEWNEVLIFEGLSRPMEYTLNIQVWDEDYVLGMRSSLASDDELGNATVKLSELKKTGEFQDMKLKIHDKSKPSMLYLSFNTLGEWGVSP